MIVKSNASQRVWLFVILWIIGTLLAYTVSGLIFHFPTGFPPNNGGRFNASGIIGGLINGTFTALLVGGIQAAILTLAYSGVWRWMLASWVALVISHSIGDMLPDRQALTTVIASGGVLLGVAQWLALRQSLPRSYLWIIANAILWPISIWLVLQWIDSMHGRVNNQLYVGITVGLLLGMVTGALWGGWLKQKSAT